ncbi:hypothetical protein PHJA_001509600 [Phtheirospermum japonicum]|uniref:Uncharacterized protein n=1 Tax=Phtheirospermum japonicum TaxID=374723 RepID=A0A830C682_9LAMI|nr:hypothetical protein PHJA_001509600 [Phtheirospermum japonicum]
MHQVAGNHCVYRDRSERGCGFLVTQQLRQSAMAWELCARPNEFVYVWPLFAGPMFKCRIGIVIDDGTASMNVIVFGLDAEKLILYSAFELSEAVQVGLDISDKLAFAINGGRILCFILHFDTEYQGQRDHKYNIVKVYTAEELLQSSSLASPVTENSTTEVTADAQSVHAAGLESGTQASQQTPVDKRFLTPASKEVLGAICQKSIAARRSLSFDLPGETAVPKPENTLMMTTVDAQSVHTTRLASSTQFSQQAPIGVDSKISITEKTDCAPLRGSEDSVEGGKLNPPKKDAKNPLKKQHTDA